VPEPPVSQQDALSFLDSLSTLHSLSCVSYSSFAFSYLDILLTYLSVDVKGANWGYKTAFLFLGTGIIVCVLTYFYVPEPSQRNPAELDELYEKGIPAWRMRNYVTDVQRLQRHNLGLADEEEKN
jgi:hypothetical protein